MILVSMKFILDLSLKNFLANKNIIEACDILESQSADLESADLLKNSSS